MLDDSHVSLSELSAAFLWNLSPDSMLALPFEEGKSLLIASLHQTPDPCPWFLPVANQFFRKMHLIRRSVS